MPDDVLVPPPSDPAARRFHATRAARLGDVSPKGRVRLDAVARYLQDIGNDDAIDAIGEDAMAWVVRRTDLEVHRWPVLRERLELLTWGSGIGSRWAERRTTITGSEGAHVEAASLWVHVDLATGRPRKLDQRFTDAYSAAIGGREVGARLRHGDAVPDVTTHAWTSRFADFDVVGHVNNAIYWAMVEEHLDLSVPGRLTVEFRGGIDRDQPVVVAVAPDRHSLWVLAEGSVAASAVLHDP